MRTIQVATGLALTALLAAGCSEEGPDTSGAAGDEESVAEPTSSPSVTAATFFPPGEGAGAVTYDETAVPEGATADVQVSTTEEESEVRFTATGLEADRDFGAHVHTQPCGDEPDDSGPHYQNEADPAADEDNPSTDPEYANPDNEVWLDFTTDDSGNGDATATVPWQFREGEAQSLVLHEEHTATEDGEAGQAGDRLGCVTVEF
ncbi:superoxide dismutase family protein [Nocardiopsis kunsanensis]|uniref:Superoxide dismutase family protein n=1 Tax=Nocardiopsis kunsanensis TaxID=141693 RepID=A0A918XJE6_9ACTN|nr:superoxide dismutase family protein [Nocardiopsis kunsanensis]GHD35145.1 hypothetical protein GCM10007147_41340 [Nocardiopsis kunsanensis]